MTLVCLTMEKPMSDISFYFMSFFFKFRDFFSSPIKILEKIGIRSGWNVLDYGAGPGSYSIPAAQLVGPTGKVYAADIHTLAISIPIIESNHFILFCSIII